MLDLADMVVDASERDRNRSSAICSEINPDARDFKYASGSKRAMSSASHDGTGLTGLSSDYTSNRS